MAVPLHRAVLHFADVGQMIMGSLYGLPSIAAHGLRSLCTYSVPPSEITDNTSRLSGPCVFRVPSARAVCRCVGTAELFAGFGLLGMIDTHAQIADEATSAAFKIEGRSALPA